MNNNTSREIEMVTLRKSPERRQSLIGSERLTRTSQLPRFHGHVLGNGGLCSVCRAHRWVALQFSTRQCQCMPAPLGAPGE